MGENLSSNSGFEGLVALVEILRSEKGCPWDRAQTAEKIKIYLIEEAYEVLNAIDGDDPIEVCAELGDLLFHIVFLARIFQESGDFNIQDVLLGITEKMTRRHPHVFGNTKVSDVDAVRLQWQEIKSKEKKESATGRFDTVPAGLPALMRAYRIGERAARLGIAQCDLQKSLNQVQDAVHALQDEVDKGKGDRVSLRYGDLLFSLVTLGRVMAVHPENALAHAVSRFLKKCRYLEEAVMKSGQNFDDLTQEQRSVLWSDLHPLMDGH